LKHRCENAAGGFYISNGQFKGAMLAAGYVPIDSSDRNWHFCAKFRQPLEAYASPT